MVGSGVTIRIVSAGDTGGELLKTTADGCEGTSSTTTDGTSGLLMRFCSASYKRLLSSDLARRLVWLGRRSGKRNARPRNEPVGGSSAVGLSAWVAEVSSIEGRRLPWRETVELDQLVIRDCAPEEQPRDEKGDLGRDIPLSGPVVEKLSSFVL